MLTGPSPGRPGPGTRIEQAALQLFAAKGFAGTGIRDIADRAGLSTAALYQDWDRGPFTEESQDHISVYEVTAAPAG